MKALNSCPTAEDETETRGVVLGDDSDYAAIRTAIEDNGAFFEGATAVADAQGDEGTEDAAASTPVAEAQGDEGVEDAVGSSVPDEGAAAGESKPVAERSAPRNPGAANASPYRTERDPLG